MTTNNIVKNENLTTLKASSKSSQSLRKVINDKCKECLYDPYDKGTWRMQVESCTSPKCPIYPVRPKPIAKKSAILPIKSIESGQYDTKECQRTGLDQACAKKSVLPPKWSNNA